MRCFFRKASYSISRLAAAIAAAIDTDPEEIASFDTREEAEAFAAAQPFAFTVTRDAPRRYTYGITAYGVIERTMDDDPEGPEEIGCEYLRCYLPGEDRIYSAFFVSIL